MNYQINKNQKLAFLFTWLLVLTFLVLTLIALTGCSEENNNISNTVYSKSCTIEADVNFMQGGIVTNTKIDCNRIESYENLDTEYFLDDILIFSVDTDSIINQKYTVK